MEEVEKNIENPVPVSIGLTAKRPFWKKLVRFFLWTGGIFIFLILVLVGLTYIYQDEVKGYVISEVNKRVNTTIIIDPKNIDLTIVKTFPDVTVIFKNIAALDANNSPKRDTLLKAGTISLGFNIMDLFHHNYSIHNISVEDAKLNVWVDEKGHDNYHFLREDADTVKGDTSHVDFALDKISFKNIVCAYSDKRSKAIYKADFKTLNFAGDFGKEKYDFETEADFTILKFTSAAVSYFTGDKGSLDLVMEIDNISNQYTIKKGDLKIADFALNVSGNVLQKQKNYQLDLAVKGDDIDLPAALSLLPSSTKNDVSDLESTGEFYIDGTIKGLYGDSIMPDVIAKFGINDGATIGRKNGSVKLTDVSMKGIFSTEKGKDGLQLSSFHAASAKSKFSGSFSLSSFNHPHYNAKLSGYIDIAELQNVLQIDTIEDASGILDLEFEATGSPAKGTTLTARDFRAFKTSGAAKLSGARIKLKDAAFAVDSINGKLSFDGNNVSVENFTAHAARSDIHINGSAKNLLGYLFTDHEVLNISGDLSSNNINLDSLVASKPSARKISSDSIYHLVLPERLKLNLNTSIHHVVFGKFEAADMMGTIQLNNQRMTADPISFHSMNGSFSGSGMIDGTRGDSLLITCNADIKDVSIYRLFYEMNNFGMGKDTAITCNNVRGVINSTINFASLWGNDLNVNEKKIYTSAAISITNGELINFKPLQVLSRFIKLDELKDIKFKSLQNTIEIKNRTINIPKMEINSSALNLTMSGTHNFDDTVDYHFIVDMDELLAKKWISKRPKDTEYGEEEDDGGHRTRIFINMKGYLDDDNITHYDRKGAAQALKEDLHAEKQNLKSILHDEWGWFKNDKDKKEDNKDRKKDDGGKFILQQDDTPKVKKKKGDDNLDDGDDYK